MSLIFIIGTTIEIIVSMCIWTNCKEVAQWNNYSQYFHTFCSYTKSLYVPWGSMNLHPNLLWNLNCISIRPVEKKYNKSGVRKIGEMDSSHLFFVRSLFLLISSNAAYYVLCKIHYSQLLSSFAQLLEIYLFSMSGISYPNKLLVVVRFCISSQVDSAVSKRPAKEHLIIRFRHLQPPVKGQSNFLFLLVDLQLPLLGIKKVSELKIKPKVHILEIFITK